MRRVPARFAPAGAGGARRTCSSGERSRSPSSEGGALGPLLLERPPPGRGDRTRRAGGRGRRRRGARDGRARRARRRARHARARRDASSRCRTSRCSRPGRRAPMERAGPGRGRGDAPRQPAPGRLPRGGRHVRARDPSARPRAGRPPPDRAADGGRALIRGDRQRLWHGCGRSVIAPRGSRAGRARPRARRERHLARPLRDRTTARAPKGRARGRRQGRARAGRRQGGLAAAGQGGLGARGEGGYGRASGRGARRAAARRAARSRARRSSAIGISSHRLTASVPAPTTWIAASAQAIGMNRCASRQRRLPIRRRR